MADAHRSAGPETPPDRVRGEDVCRFFVPDTRRGAGVLVLCEPGADALAREACARLARHGFVAHAPALPEASEAELSEAERSAVDAGIHALFCEHATEGARLGVLGFGRGGRLGLDAAARGGRIATVVSFCGAWGDHPGASSSASVLAIFAEGDPALDAGHDALEARLRRAAGRCELRVQEGVAPGFLDPARPDQYDAVAARASWDAALARLRAEL